MKTTTKQFALGLATILLTAAAGWAQQGQTGGNGGNGGFQGNGGNGGGGRFNRQQNQGGNNGGGNGGNNGGGNNGGGNNGGGNNGGGNNGGGYGGFNGGGYGGFGGGGRQRNGFGGGGGGGFGRRNGGDPAAGVFGQTQSTDGIDIPTPDPMSSSYLALTQRSIFFRGRFIPVDETQNQNNQGQQREEGYTVLVGLINTDGSMTAYVEDQNTGRITPCRVGEEIAQGKVTRITLDEMDYQSNGRIVHVLIGQNLVGQQIQGAGALLTTALPTADLSGPNADILRRMMQRRQQELGGNAAPVPTAVPTPTMAPTVTPGR